MLYSVCCNHYFSLTAEQCEMRSLELDRIELKFVIALDAAESGESWENFFLGVDEAVH